MHLEKVLSKLTPKERGFISTLIERDPLTGVYNRRKFNHDIQLLVSMAERMSRGSALLIIDIDDFKKFNDEFGHTEGDKILRKVAQVIEKNLRNYDKIHIYRYGGEEFILIIPDTTASDAYAIGERLRQNVRNSCGVTVSIGVSHYKEISSSMHELIVDADKALYEAKRAGKNQVAVYYKRPH